MSGISGKTGHVVANAVRACGKTCRASPVVWPRPRRQHVMYSAPMFQPALTATAALAAILLLIPTAARAADGAPIHRAVEDFLTARGKDLPGPARHVIGPIKANSLAEGCRAMKATMDSASRPWGRTHVSVRCTDGAAWKVYVPVQISVTVNCLLSARPLRAGQAIVEADLAQGECDLADFPNGVLTDRAQALGQTVSVALPAQRPLRADQLRQPMVVRQGQSVRLIAAGAGFQVASEGRALANAVSGQVVQVRTGSGQVVSGIARSDGSVEVAH